MLLEDRINIFNNRCAGKTTGLAFVSDLIRDRGFEVFVIPECATSIGRAGGEIKLDAKN